MSKNISGKIHPLVLTAWQMLLGSVVLLLIGYPGLRPQAMIFTPKAWVLLFYAAFLSAAAFSLWYAVLKYNKAGEISVYMFMTPVSGTKSVKAVYVNLNDWEIRPVLAKNTVGATESLADMAKRAGAEAAINGTYFASYTDKQPQGTVQIDGNFAHIGNNGTTIGVTFDNKIQIENLFVGIEGSINDSFE